MNLTAGTVIDMLDGSSVTVQAFLADGGQGEVYRVIRSDGKVKALKWYVNPRLVSNVAFRTTLRNNSQRRPPSSAFLWPEGLTRVQYGSFGYVMRLRPPGYYDLGDFFCIDRYPDAWFRSYMARINAALRICDSFSSLHNSGLSYQDVNDGNFLINPATGDVLICDTDNIVPDGHNNGVSGKSRYMAPEVAAGNIPSRASDRLSLAIILYRIFMLDHPFEGRNTVRERYRCLTPESEKYLYGRGAVFCYDPANASNRPVGGIHGNSILYWPMLPKFFREAFGKALSRAAINCPADRTSASEWKKILLTARALTLTCHADPDDGIHDFTASPDYGGVCPVCGHTTPKWVTLAFADGSRYRLSDGKALYLGDSFVPTGTAMPMLSGGVPGSLALKNLTVTTWGISMPSGIAASVAPGAICRLTDGMIIRFSPSAAARVIIQ